MMRKRLLVLLAGVLLISIHTRAQDDFEIMFTDDKGRETNVDVMVPEAMTDELDSLLASFYSSTYLKLDDNCEPSAYSPQFDREVYIDRLRRMPTVMEMPYNDIVRRFIDRYSQRMRRQVSVMLGASNFYMPIFEQALEAYGCPMELKYLPVIESALNPKAVSRAGATGLWQFMLATGKQYGLRVNSLVDDRRDPLRSSYAAARYLRDLYKIFHDWTLVIAAYNCGPENVNRAIRRSNGQKDYWKIYPYLPAETRGYVPAFIAANYIMNYYCEHNICPMDSELPMKTDTIAVTRDIHMKQISQICNVDINLLRELNPQYRRDIVNGSSEPSILRMPIAAINKFIDNEDSIYNYRSSEYLPKRREVEVSESRPSSRRESSRSGRQSYRESEKRESSSASSNGASSSRSHDRYGHGRYGYHRSDESASRGHSRHSSHSSAPAPTPKSTDKSSHNKKKDAQVKADSSPKASSKSKESKKSSASSDKANKNTSKSSSSAKGTSSKSSKNTSSSSKGSKKGKK